jgi:preprotein translocase subunit SecE
VARDRKRAKQRRERARSAGAARGAQAVKPSQPVREDLPGALEHASGEVDEFDAALVRGASGVPAPAEPEPEPEADAELGDGADGLQEVGVAVAGGRAGAPAPARVSGAPLHGGNRVAGFLAASWAELQRVQWPDRRQVTQATAVVIGFVAIAGAYLGLADFVAKEIVEIIL